MDYLDFILMEFQSIYRKYDMTYTTIKKKIKFYDKEINICQHMHYNLDN